MLRDVIRLLFSPSPKGAEAHAYCVSLETHRNVLHEAKTLASECKLLQERIAQVEQRLEAAEARATEYGRQLGQVRRAAFPVSLFLCDGDIEAAIAINAKLWELVKGEVDEA